ncbi:DUF4372 domain-containing protein [Candidatus Vondammii sp. HM_W22]|uniref:DUF4372 domain-containing protein n=1 Tax=Candidatus Vondammii sp. HM_W22 TaxID=2687299 RepID=UPI00403E0AA5
MATAQLTGRASLPDIESALASQKHLTYHLGSGSIKRTTLSRANQNLSSGFYEELFGKLYERCSVIPPKNRWG